MPESLSNNTKFFICSTVSSPTTLANYQALTWTEVGGVYDLGEFGDVQEAIESKAIGDSRVRRLKGTVDGGTIELVVNRLPTDAGQIALKTAAADNFDRPFKIVLPDRLAPAGKDSELYFTAAILGGRMALGEVDNVIRTTWSIAINTERLETAPTAV